MGSAQTGSHFCACIMSGCTRCTWPGSPVISTTRASTSQHWAELGHSVMPRQRLFLAPGAGGGKRPPCPTPSNASCAPRKHDAPPVRVGRFACHIMHAAPLRVSGSMLNWGSFQEVRQFGNQARLPARHALNSSCFQSMLELARTDRSKSNHTTRLYGTVPRLFRGPPSERGCRYGFRQSELGVVVA